MLQHEPNVPECVGEYPMYLSYDSDEPDPALMEELIMGAYCIGVRGCCGCEWEQTFKAAARALIDNRDGANAGFLRQDSILVIIFLSDEEENSVAPGNEGIFNPEDESLGSMMWRYYTHSEMLDPVEKYVDAFETLRSDPEDLLLAFFVAVPVNPVCQGSGDEITDCLNHPDMIELWELEPWPGLHPSCTSPFSMGYPPRRYVRMAQHFGDRAVVHSVCNWDHGPAIEILHEKLGDRIGDEFLDSPLPVEKHECMCRATCTLIEEMVHEGPCPDDKPCYDPEGPGGCAFEEDEDGARHALCTIPQVDTFLDDCSLDCNDPSASRTPHDAVGWYSVPSPVAGPRLVLTAGVSPESGSSLYLSCCFPIGGP